MYWTLELASHLSDAPWPATKDELIDYAIRTGAPLEVVENLQAMEDEGDSYDRLTKYGQTIRLKTTTSGMRMNTRFYNILNIKKSRNEAFFFA